MAAVLFVIEPLVGPDIFVHRYEEIVPSGSVPLPERLAEAVGIVITWSEPALAVGGTFAAPVLMSNAEVFG